MDWREVALYITREIAHDLIWVGVNDRRLDRFENMFPLPQGVAYHAYLIRDEKTVLLDTVDSSVQQQFLENVEHALGGRDLDYLVINHMEPDHCGSIEAIMSRYPEARLVGNRKTFDFFNQYYRSDIKSRMLVVKEQDKLSTGTRSLQFHLAPMVHWPEVMMTMDLTNGILFSADAFGSFGALPGNLFADELDHDNLFADETRRYYANIIGRYGSQVQAVLKRLQLERVHMICPLHGPIWRKDLGKILEKYRMWSTYRPEKPGVILIYASMYGNTEQAVTAMANKLAERGVPDMRVHDVSKTHPSYIIAEAWKYSHLIIASPTYNMQLYPPVESLLREFAMLNLQNRSVAIIGNHTWSSAAVKQIAGLLGTMKDMRIIGSPLDIQSSLKTEEEGLLDSLADAITHSVIQQI